MKLISALITGVGLLWFAAPLAHTSDKITMESNKAIVTGYLNDVVNANNLDAWDRYFGPQVSFNGDVMKREDFVGMMTFFRTAFPDLNMTVEDQWAEGLNVATRVTIRGTHKGPFAGIDATGKKVEFLGLMMDRVDDGRVVEMWHEMDLFGVLQQLQAD